MDFLSLSFRLAQANQGAIFYPYVIEGCSDDDVAAISEAFRPYLRPRVDSLYNTWEVVLLGDEYAVRRSTWNKSEFFDGRESLIAFIHDHYAKRSPEFGSPNHEKMINRRVALTDVANELERASIGNADGADPDCGNGSTGGR